MIRHRQVDGHNVQANNIIIGIIAQLGHRDGHNVQANKEKVGVIVHFINNDLIDKRIQNGINSQLPTQYIVNGGKSLNVKTLCKIIDSAKLKVSSIKIRYEPYTKPLKN